MPRVRNVWFVALCFSMAAGAVIAACGSPGTASEDGFGNDHEADGGAGSGRDSGGFPDDEPGRDDAIESLSIDPTSATLTVDQTTPKSQAFAATARYPDGSTKAVKAKFSIDNSAPGSIDASTGVFTTSNTAGGLVHVTASYGGKEAKAELKVMFQPTVSDGSTPDDVADLFDPSKNTPVFDDSLAPSIVYPSDGTKFPTNVYKILFQWRDRGLTLFRVRFEAPYLNLSIYTDGSEPTCVGAKNGVSCWEATESVWKWLASTAAGSSVKLTVEGADPTKPGSFYVASSIDLHFSKNAVPGAIYYWSTTSEGVMRATVSDAAPSPFMTPTEVGKCVACHTLSRNGKRLGADVGGENLWVVDVSPTVPPPVVFNKSNNKDIPNAWSTFNYDATRVVSAKGGVMKLLDGDTGAPIGPDSGRIALPAKTFGTQQDWAPNGKKLAFAYGTEGKDRGLKGSSLAMLDYASDQFSNITIVRQSAGASDTYGYPMFDPSSQWLVYMHAAGASDKNAAAKLFLAAAKEGADETDLVKANTVVADGVVPTGIANNMPTWAPTADGDDTLFIAFASTRDYGLVLAKGSKHGSGRQQLWVAALDPAKFGHGDPSFPAFRLPFQLLQEDNHRPFWAEDALEPCEGDGCDGGTGDGGTGEPDSGIDLDAGTCANLGEDCTATLCCGGLQCLPNADGTAYTCGTIIR